MHFYWLSSKMLGRIWFYGKNLNNIFLLIKVPDFNLMESDICSLYLKYVYITYMFNNWLLWSLRKFKFIESFCVDVKPNEYWKDFIWTIALLPSSWIWKYYVIIDMITYICKSIIEYRSNLSQNQNIFSHFVLIYAS